MLQQAGQIKIQDSEIKEIIRHLRRLNRRLEVNQKTKKNRAKQTAQLLHGFLPVIVASEFLAGNAHLFRNQLHENSKTFANYFVLPEVNHHLMEGLNFPADIKRRLRFLLIESGLYLQKNQKRYKVTKKVLTRNKIRHLSYHLKSSNKLPEQSIIIVRGNGIPSLDYMTYRGRTDIKYHCEVICTFIYGRPLSQGQNL